MKIDRDIVDTIGETLADYVAEVEDSDRGRVAKESDAYHSAGVRALVGRGL